MPSFDIVSEVDMHEATNAVDQANRELSTRYDFKGVEASYSLKDSIITQTTDSDFQLNQMLDILYSKLTKRGIELACLEVGKIIPTGKQVKQELTIKQGIETDLAKKIVKLIKEQKLKVQAAIQGEKVRVTGKKRDDLQQTIQFLKSSDEIKLPLQFENFRD
ncbi:MAG: YajQ family cyclic di-GMP-binding protein [Gammaproteobacteria bacterium]|nr:MAG: YajQ family cyclic di-GMP-binding protein [Gammaproteobacteria bacterium]